MKFTLRVLQTPQGVPPIEPRPIDADSCPFAIGRGPDNDWVLEDPDRHISKVHCRIIVEGDGFYLLDTSSNGVFFAAEPRPVGRGERRPLDAGDSFRIGDYRILLGHEASGTLSSAAHGPDLPYGAAGPAVSDILAGTNGGGEQRAARSVTGPASEWLDGLPNGAVDDQIVRPLGWQAPPATTLTDLPEDMTQPLSEFASLSEHVPAVNGALQIGGAKAILPLDWNIVDSASAPDTPLAMPGASAEADWRDAQSAILEGAMLSGLVAEVAPAGQDRDALIRAGRIMRRLVDALAALEAVQRTTERDLGLADAASYGEDMPTLLAAALWAADVAATDTLIQRLAGLARNARALGLSVVEAAGEVGAQILPEAIEEDAHREARLAVGPLLRAASWERYCAVHANLAGLNDAPAADAFLAPLRRAFAQKV